MEEHRTTEQPPIRRPDALYGMYDVKTVAGLDALLCGEQASASLLEYLSLNRVLLGNGAFCLLAARVAWEEEKAGSEFESLLDATDCFSEMLEDQLLQRAIYHMLPLQGLVVCCISMPQYTAFTEEVARKEEKLHGYCIAGIDAFREKTGMEVLVEASPVSFGTQTLSGTFERTLDRLRMAVFLGQTSGLHTPVKLLPRRDIFLYTEMEQDYAVARTMLQGKDYDGFQRCVQNRLEQLAALEPMSLSIFHANCYRFLDMLCCQLTRAGLLDGQALARVDLWGMIQQAESFTLLKDAVRELLDRLTAAMRRKWQTGVQDRVQIHDVQQYMREHLQDPNLTVSAMAVRFGMSQPVFSAWFKKYAGVSPLEYLTRLRMERAALLLQTTTATLDQIAEQAGFGSVSTFHRVCRARTGMTPARLRMAGPAGEQGKPVGESGK